MHLGLRGKATRQRSQVESYGWKLWGLNSTKNSSRLLRLSKHIPPNVKIHPDSHTFVWFTKAFKEMPKEPPIPAWAQSSTPSGAGTDSEWQAGHNRLAWDCFRFSSLLEVGSPCIVYMYVMYIFCLGNNWVENHRTCTILYPTFQEITSFPIDSLHEINFEGLYHHTLIPGWVQAWARFTWESFGSKDSRQV